MKVRIKTLDQLLATGARRESDGLIYGPIGSIGHLTGSDTKVLGKTATFLRKEVIYNAVKYRGVEYLIPNYAILTKKEIINAFFTENH